MAYLPVCIVHLIKDHYSWCFPYRSSFGSSMCRWDLCGSYGIMVGYDTCVSVLWTQHTTITYEAPCMLSAARDTLIFFLSPHTLVEMISHCWNCNLLTLLFPYVYVWNEKKKFLIQQYRPIFRWFVSYDRFSFALDEDDAKFAVHANKTLVLWIGNKIHFMHVGRKSTGVCLS